MESKYPIVPLGERKWEKVKAENTNDEWIGILECYHDT
jgi:hypothetical protein